METTSTIFAAGRRRGLDGTSPFGVLVKKIGGDDTTVPTTNPTQKSPAPLAGIIAGFGAALVIARMRR